MIYFLVGGLYHIGIHQESAVSMGPKIVRNGGASLWGRTRSKNLHKAVKSNPDCSKKVNGQPSAIFGRFFNHGQNKGGSHTGKGLSTVSPANARFY